MPKLSRIPRGPLEELFDDMDDAIFIIREDGGLLFRNRAAIALCAARPNMFTAASKFTFRGDHNNLTVARLVRLCQHRLHAGLNACSLRLPKPAPRERWLLSVSPLTCSLAVLHPVFVVRLIRWQRLPRIPGYLLRKLFELTRLESTIVNAIGCDQSLVQIAKHLNLSRQTVGQSMQRIKHKCAVHSRAELLALLHSLQYLCA